MNDIPIEIPEEWRTVFSRDLSGTIMIFGQVDSGKSTLARSLYKQAIERSDKVAYLDADLGQQSIGPPAAITLALSSEDDGGSFPPGGPTLIRFVGNNTPRGHFVPLLIALQKLQQHAFESDAKTIIIDTSGFINPIQGAAVLKWAKVDLLEPSLLIALQKEKEMEPILAPLRRLMGDRLTVLPPASSVDTRSAEERQAYRAQRYQEYFQDAQQIILSYRRLAVFPQRTFITGQLLALNDESGFVLALGVIESTEPEDQAITIRTPWWGDGKVTSLYLGSLKLNLDSFLDEPI